ncbi:MAG: response regulator [Bacteroidetes bacterium]|nr:response regulator [Bacteroidota bacterium]
MKPRILLMEDKAEFRATLAMNLQLEGYVVKEASDGREALEIFDSEHFDLCILDVMVPEISGHQVCERIRLKEEKLPIIFLSAMTMTQDRINGLKCGADDYVVKPFHLEELLLKVERHLRKGIWMENPQSSYSSDEKQFFFGENEVNFDTYEGQGAQGTFTLTKKEADLLKLFFDHPNEILSRERILHTVWGYNVYPHSRSVDNFVLFLRQKFEHDTKNPLFFRSVRGAGYRFTPDGA